MKKLICLILTFIMVCALFAVNASAAELMPLSDFTIEDGEAEREGWTRYSTGGISEVSVTQDPLDPENMVLALLHDPERETGGGIVTGKSFDSPMNGEVVCMFDIMFAKAQSCVFIEVGINGMRFSSIYRTENFGSPNVWYSVLVHIEEGNAKGNLYKKVRDGEEGYTRITTDHATAANNLSGISLYTTKGKLSTVGDPDIIYIDNCRALNGLYMKDISFMLGENEVTSVADITEGGNLTARYNLVNANLSEESEDLVSEYSSMLPAMVVFDKKGKMLDCVSYEDSMAFLDNPVELTVDTSAYGEKLEGGCVKLYLLDSLRGLQVLMDEVILPAN